MAAIWYRRQAGRVLMTPPVRDDFDQPKPWTPYRRVWVTYRCAHMLWTVEAFDEQIIQ